MPRGVRRSSGTGGSPCEGRACADRRPAGARRSQRDWVSCCVHGPDVTRCSPPPLQAGVAGRRGWPAGAEHLARTIHEGPTAAAHLRTLEREIDVRLLDVLPSTSPGEALRKGSSPQGERVRVRRFLVPEHESARPRYEAWWEKRASAGRRSRSRCGA
jgi:hypothetical protein